MPVQPHLDGRMNREVVSSHVGGFATPRTATPRRIFHVEGDNVYPTTCAREPPDGIRRRLLGGREIAGGLVL